MREVYKGELTDAANWGGEEVDKLWWDAVDVIGVDAYYPIGGDNRNPTTEDLVEAWQPIIDTLRGLHLAWNKPV